MTKQDFLKLIMILSLLIPLSSSAGSSHPIQPNSKDVRQVQVEIFLLDLDAIDSASQSFDANVYFEVRWKDPALVEKGRDQIISRRLDEVWNPRLQILNQQRAWSTLPEIVEIEEGGIVTQRARVWGSFSQPLDLREFPFDTQTINIQVVAAGYTTDELELVQGSASGISSSFSIADWKVVDWRIAKDVNVPGPPGSHAPSIALVLEVERLQAYYWIKVIAPLILIVAMSWAVFWIDPKDTGTKISITITAMLTLIAYRFAIGASLPAISYLTRMDLFILFSTILIYASLVAVVVTAAYARKGNSILARGIDRTSRWGFPLFFIGSWVVSMVTPL